MPKAKNRLKQTIFLHMVVIPCISFKEAAVRDFFLRIVLIGVLLACASSIVMKAQGNPEAAKVKNPVALTPESIAAGKQVYTRFCATCHGTSAQGGSGSDIIPPAPNLTD